MTKPSPQIQVARPEDAQTWVQLAYPGDNAPSPDALDAEIKAFNAPPPDIDESRFIIWLDDKPVARASFNQLENVVELRDFMIADGYIADYGAAILQSIADVARTRGNLLTIEFYPPTYSRSFIGAGFKENTRTRMIKSLADYTPQPIELPDDITLRHPIFNDEAAVAEMVYNNYKGTADEEMVSSSRAQAAAIIRAMLHNDYNLLDPNGTYLAIDKSGSLVGDVILGDASSSPSDRQAWIMDVSIAQAFRGKGLGKALLLSAINAAKADDYPRIGLIVTIGSSNAQSLYRSLGFEDYGDIMHEAMMKLRTI
jgi:ribosomal protein S18 acetylase RimI-like enzyme